MYNSSACSSAACSLLRQLHANGIFSSSSMAALTAAHSIAYIFRYSVIFTPSHGLYIAYIVARIAYICNVFRLS